MNPNTPNVCPECGKSVPPDSQHQICPACLMAQALASQTAAADRRPIAPAPSPSPEEIADKFPQFEILACLGRGGMGVVYKARQKSLNRLVAIKILAPEREHDSKFSGRFAREAELLAKLSHPHIVTIHDFGETGGLYYLVMEFVDGVSLRDLLREGKLEPEQALAIVPEICDALQFAHDHGIVHRDIKPENILLDRLGRVKVADFGLAKLVADSVATEPGQSAPGMPAADDLTEAGKTMGTPNYMAPEQTINPDSVDSRADIYSLGVVFYQMLTGELPSRLIEPPSRKVQIDVRLDEVVLRALEGEPRRRYQQASIFKTQVEMIAETPTAKGARPAAQESAEQNLIHWEGITKFRSLTALRIAQLACAGCLGFLGYIPGWERLFGLFGLFGLIGIAYLFEASARSNTGRIDSNAQEVQTDIFITPHFSRTAIIGASWVGVASLAVLVLRNIFGEPAKAWMSMSQIAKVGFVFADTVVLAGCLAPFITTILGWIAVSQIRRSSGKLYGIGLALFDGLFFPLLAMDYAIAFFIHSAGIAFHLWTQEYDEVSNAWLTILSIITWIIVDFIIIRWCWRVVNQNNQIGTPATAGSRRSTSLYLLLIAFAAAFLLAAAFAFSPPSVAIPSFGPAIERTIETGDSSHRALNLASGDFMSPSRGRAFVFRPAGADTLRVADVDLYSSDDALSADNINTLDMRLWLQLSPQNTSRQPFNIDDISAQQFEQLLEDWNRFQEPMEQTGVLGGGFGFDLSKVEPVLRGRDVYLFITRGGSRGILQITDVTDNPRSAKIRYKLILDGQSALDANYQRHL